MDWLNNPEIPCIEWCVVDEQTCIYIKDKTDFANKYCSGNFTNFRRQLSEYGFTKINVFRGRAENSNRAIYYREGFVAGADVSNLRKQIVEKKQKINEDSIWTNNFLSIL